MEKQGNLRSCLFQMIGDSAMDGFKIAVVVAVMLLAFISLMEAINIMFGSVGLNFKQLIGYVFAPIAFLMGIPWSEAVPAGSLMATKLITNEFVAMLDFKMSWVMYLLEHKVSFQFT